ncbi:hypothetical protein K474DRAFT_1655440 [Panus rudis PR-1116 ss-1]|nr:hypothetical protein K474DRAFT_1655440 [Panus rudis PR-1116 ss-1]
MTFHFAPSFSPPATPSKQLRLEQFPTTSKLTSSPTNLLRKLLAKHASRTVPTDSVSATSSCESSSRLQSASGGVTETVQFAQRISQALFNQMAARGRHRPRTESISSVSSRVSTTSTSSSRIPELDLDFCSEASTPFSSGIHTPSPSFSLGLVDGPEQGVSEKLCNNEHRVSNSPGSCQLPPNAILSACASPRRRKPTYKPSRSRASALRAALCTPSASPGPRAQPLDSEGSVASSAFIPILAPLPRFTPHRRVRAASLSSIGRAPVESRAQIEKATRRFSVSSSLSRLSLQRRGLHGYSRCVVGL